MNPLKKPSIREIYAKIQNRAGDLLKRANKAADAALDESDGHEAALIAARVNYFIERLKSQMERVNILPDDGNLRAACEKFDRPLRIFVEEVPLWEARLSEIEEANR